MFSSVLSNTTEGLTVVSALLCTGTSLVLGLVIALCYMKQGKYTRNFVLTLALLPVLVQVVITMVNGNLGAGVAVMGAFSLVRFRSVPGSSKEIAAIFFAMAAGLATGMGYLTFALAITAIICLVQLVLAHSAFGREENREKEMTVLIPESLDYTEVFDDLFAEYTKTAELERVKTTNLGSMFELTYRMELRDSKQEKKLIDAIRCRNGNLTVSCRLPQSREQL